MVRPARRLVDPAAADALLKHRIRDLQGEDGVDALAVLGQQGVQGIGLDEGTREAIEDEARGAVRLL